MRALPLLLLATLLAPFPAGADGPVADAAKMAGLYQEPHSVSVYDPERREWEGGIAVTDQMEILPVPRGRPAGAEGAFVRLDLSFDNGHQCHFSGIAMPEGGALVHRGPAWAEEPACVLRLRPTASGVVVEDDGAACRRMACGARGALDREFSLGNRGPLPDPDRLRASEEYRAALREHRAEGASQRLPAR